jgi:hypothetical protein
MGKRLASYLSFKHDYEANSSIKLDLHPLVSSKQLWVTQEGKVLLI